MKITDCFERVFVINLPYKEDRRARLSAHLEEVGIADVDKIRWVRAVSGDDCGAPHYFKAGNGPWGCLQSHMRIAQDAVADKLSNYLVLEDDAIFHQRAPELLERLMTELPKDWGQLYLGGQHLKPPSEAGGSTFVIRGENVNRTHAFALQSDTFVPFLRHISEAPEYISREHGWHIDHQLGTAHEKREWNVYCPSWWIAGQEEGASNISGSVNPRLWWNDESYSKQLPFLLLEPELRKEEPDGTPCPEAEILDRYVHFGNTLKPETWEDVGLDSCFESFFEVGNNSAAPKDFLVCGRINSWLAMIAREAMDMGRIPGIQHSDITSKMLRDLWKPGLISLKDADFAALVDYPFNGLFPHPVTD